MQPKRALVGDTLLALGLAIFGGVATANIDTVVAPDRELDAYGIALVTAAALVLVLRRRRPLATLAGTTACTATYLLLGYPYGPILVSLLIAVYTAARYLPLHTSLPACVAAIPALLAHLFTNSAALPGFLGVVPGSAWVVVPLAVGITVRQARLTAEQARAELIRERVADERLRVAQEVHDVVGHGLAAIKMQADVALHVLDKKPEQAATALESISSTSGQALDELRATLALIRREEDDRAPGPGLDRLEDLRRRMSDAGITIEVTTTGTPAPLPQSVDLVAYRVLQEALTNVLRHSPSRVADVRVGYETDAVSLTVASSGMTRTDSSGGLGIPGMRKRVESLGGTFFAGPKPQDRFEVHARMPIGADP
ncbi:sensor histidine kinase [Halopolyspora algeriensis]|nr:sensor histidine kinase [Halopolyspora algeriensis]